MSPIDRLLTCFAAAKTALLLACAAMIAAGLAACGGSDPIGTPCVPAPNAIDACPFGLECLAKRPDLGDPGVCGRICGNSAPDPVSDIPCAGSEVCLTTATDYGAAGTSISRLCFARCDDGGCDYGVPTIAADGTCACIPVQHQLHNGGF